MKRHLLLLLFALLAGGLFGQEICDNGLDDDGDGLIDLNDTTDCICSLASVVESLFFNASFDEFENDADCQSQQTNGAPDGPGQADCIAGWEQASDATTDAWHLLTYNGNPPNWPSSIPEPIPSGLAVAGMFIGVSAIPDYREYLGSCLPGGPVMAGEDYRLNFKMGFGNITGNGVDSIIYSPSPATMSLYGIPDCDDLRFSGNTCPEEAGAVGWELITTFTVSGAVPSWQDVNVDFTPTQDYGAIALGGSCAPVSGPPNADFWRRYYFFDDMVLNFQSVFENTLTVGPISVTGTDICDDSANMIAQSFPDATYQWYRNGIAIVGATTNEYYPELDANFPGFYSVLVTRPEGCGIAGPVDLIRPVVTNAFQDSVFFCANREVVIQPISEGNLVQEYLWQDGSMQETLLVTTPGTYMVTITSFCEQTIETIYVVDDEEPTYRLVIEPAVFCVGDTIKTYFETNWQLELIGFGPSLPGNFTIGDTIFFVPEAPVDEIRVFVQTQCFGNDIEEYELIAANFLNGVDVGSVSCTNPVTTAVPDVNASDLLYTWYDADNNIISTDSTLEIATPGNYRLEVGSTAVDCTEEESFTVVFDEDEEILNSVALILLSCEQPSGPISVLLNFPDQTLIRWEDPAGNLLGENDTLIVNAPGTYFLTGFLLNAAGDTICVQTEDYTIPFIENGVIITAWIVPILRCGNSSNEIQLTVENPDQTVFVWRDAAGNVLPSDTSRLSVNEPGFYEVQAFLLSTDGDTICRETRTYEVMFDAGAAFIAQAEVPTLNCLNLADTIRLTVEEPTLTTFEWTDATGNPLANNSPNLPVDAAGTFAVFAYVLNDLGDTICQGNGVYEVQFEDTNDFITVDNVPALDCVESAGTIDLSSFYPTNVSYEWRNDANELLAQTQDLAISLPGSYTVNAIFADAANNAICTFSETFQVIENNVVTFSVDQVGENCDGQSRATVDVTTAGNWTFNWTSSSNPPLTTNSETILLNAGLYELVVTNGENCTAAQSVQIDTIPLLTLATDVTFPDCPSSVADTGTLLANLVLLPGGGEAPYTYDLGDTTTTSALPIFRVSEGNYVARVTDARGCAAEVAQTNVTFPEILEIFAGVDQRINLGDSTRLLVQTNGANVTITSITWTPATGLSCTDCPNPIAGPYETTTYLVTYLTEDGCQIVDEVRLGIVPTGQLYIPNAFSPNNDGVNDNFQLFPDGSVAEVLDFSIFDRWGGLVHQESGQRGSTTGWNGLIRNGQPASAGVYVYLASIRLLNGEEKEFRGTVNLLR